GRRGVDHRARERVFPVRPGGGRRDEKSRLADPQGILSDHRRRVRVRGGDGGVPVDHRQGPRIRDLRLVSRGEKVTMRWYVVHAYSGFEKSLQRTLLDRFQSANMLDKFGLYHVPSLEIDYMWGVRY